jgi:hypothetical protein
MIETKSRWIPWIACGGILATSGIAWAVLSLLMGDWTLASAPIQLLGIILGVIVCLVVATVFAFLARNRGHRTMAKLIGILLMSYVPIALIGTLVRFEGWFLSFGSSTIRGVCLKVMFVSLVIAANVTTPPDAAGAAAALSVSVATAVLGAFAVEPVMRKTSFPLSQVSPIRSPTRLRLNGQKSFATPAID